MSKQEGWKVFVAVALLIVLAYFFFKPTGNVIYEPSGDQIFSTDLASCQVLNEGGLYVFSGDVVAGENATECFSVLSDDVVLDLLGFVIGGENASVPGVVAGGVSGLVVKNGAIFGEGDDVVLTGNASGTVLNVTVADTNVEEGSSLSVQWYVFVSVLDQDGAGVAGAFVLFGDENGTTDSDGALLASEEDGTYAVLVTSDGYTNASGEAVVSGGNVAVALSVNDTQVPVVTYVDATEGVLNVTLHLNVTDNGLLDSCSAWYANGTGENDTVIEVLDNSSSVGDVSLYVGSLALGTTYEVRTGCVDTAGNVGNSSLFNVTTLSADPQPEEDSSDDSSSDDSDDDSDSSDSSDSSSERDSSTESASESTDVPRTYVLSADAFQKTGASKFLKEGDKVRFVLDGKLFFVSLKGLVDNQTALVEVLADVAVVDTLSLATGGIGLSDVDDDGVYEVFVLFRGVKNGKAELFVKSTDQPVPDSSEVAEVAEGEALEVQGGALTGQAIEEDVGQTSLATKIVVVLLVLIVVVFWLIRRKKGGKGGLFGFGKGKGKKGSMGAGDLDKVLDSMESK